MTLVNPTIRRRLVAALGAVCTLLAAGCGGGNHGVSVTSMSAANVRYNATLTVTVNGVGLTDPDLFMTVDGPCTGVTRAAGSVDYQTQFTCKVDGVGEVVPHVRVSSGLSLASLKLQVPLPQVTLTTRRAGVLSTMVVDLDPVAAPVTVKNFLNYVAAGFYRNTIFHRVIKDSLVQGGGYTSGPTAVTTGLQPAIPLESNNGLKNLRGTIAMARTLQPDTATSQFYLNIADNAAFDYVDAANPGYAVFGRLVSGLDVLDAIGNVEISALPGFPSLPAQDVVVTQVVQTR